MIEWNEQESETRDDIYMYTYVCVKERKEPMSHHKNRRINPRYNTHI